MMTLEKSVAVMTPSTWAPVVLVFIVLLASQAAAMPGVYISNDMLNNQLLEKPLPGGEHRIENRQECEEHCIKHPECDAYSISIYFNRCYIYKIQVGAPASIKNNYKLYVRQKTKEEGYYMIGTNYVKLMMSLQNAQGASDECATEGGILVPIRNEVMNNLVYYLLNKHSVFRAFIGVNDMAEEGRWVYSNQGNAVYTNWAWNGMWERTDKNCASMGVDGYWRHFNCWDKIYFVCQIPMY